MYVLKYEPHGIPARSLKAHTTRNVFNVLFYYKSGCSVSQLEPGLFLYNI